MKRFEVDAKEFRALMKRVGISKRKSAHELATITFRKGFGELEVGATTLTFYADGDWKGQAKFTAANARRCARVSTQWRSHRHRIRRRKDHNR